MADDLALRALEGLPLSAMRHAADMLVCHFGAMTAHPSGRGTIGEFALHVQCPWRLDERGRTITGSDDAQAGTGEQGSIQSVMLTATFGAPNARAGWSNATGKFVVSDATISPFGDLIVSFSGGEKLSVFPAGVATEAWRLLQRATGEHRVFPPEVPDITDDLA